MTAFTGSRVPVGSAAIVAVARAHAFSDEERSLLAYLCGRAAVSAENVARHETLHRHALTDSLTGLANHRRFQEAVAEVCARGHDGALLLLDLDDFKLVNDRHGHLVGDTVLQSVARCLQSVCGSDDEPARHGGEELAIVMPSADSDAAVELGERLRRAVAELDLTDADGNRLPVTASIGVAALDEHVDSPAQLVRLADRALYQAKREGKNRVRRAESGMATDDAQLVAELRRAIAHDELVVHYQPKASLVTGRVEGVEALVRWQHPTLGLLAPAAFMDVAEKADLLGPLTRAVLDQAVGQCRRWRDAGLDVSVSVNISASSLTDDRLVGDVTTAVERHGLTPNALILELTETTIMQDAPLAVQVLRRLRDLGVRVSVDDYGTGYSSLAYLKQFKLDELKLDRAFVRDLAEDADAEAIVRSTVELAHALGLRIVAEGVETDAAWEALARLGCDSAQGYLLSRPQPAYAMSDWLLDRERAPRAAA